MQIRNAGSSSREINSLLEGKPRHQSALFKPEDGTETTREKYAFNCGKSYQALGEGAVVYPAQRPLRFFANTWHRINGMEQPVAFSVGCTTYRYRSATHTFPYRMFSIMIWKP